MDVSRFSIALFSAVLAVALAGCGQSAPQTATDVKTAAETPDESPANPPSAAISGGTQTEPDDDETLTEINADDLKIEPVKQGSAEWLLQEITKLKLEPLANSEDVEALRTQRRERNAKIITLSEKALGQTHKDKAREQVFIAAARHLLDARYELALQGAAEDIDALFTDAQALIDRDKTSKTANLASFTLVNLAYNLAKRPQTPEKSWVKEFAAQATFFGTSYPHEEMRGPSMLFNAGRSCELHGLTQEAIGCYTTLQNTFPKSPLAEQSTGMLRRLRLIGGPAQIAGPTLDGKDFSSDDLLGKPMLIVFWASVAKPFEQQLPKIQQAVKKHSASGLVVVGVNLDSEPEAVQQFMAQHKLAWPQIFFPDAERRGWNHPLAVYYGVMEIPAYWLIDANGVVASTTVTAANLDAQLTEVLSGVAPAKESTKEVPGK